MFASISERLTQELEENQTIQSKNRDIYQYGIQQGFTILLSFMTTVLIGALCGMLWQSIVFTVAYIPLRSYAGGYHAKTPFRCYLFSIAQITIILLVMRLFAFTNLIYSILLLSSSIVIFSISPVADNHKPLDSTEKRVYRKRTLLIGVFEVMCVIICMLFKWQEVAVCLTMTIASMSIMLILGKLKNILIKSSDAA